MDILGVSCFYHDSAACLVRDGKILAAAQEERFTRKKHDHSFPQHAIQFCLSDQGVTANDLDLVVFYENPAVKFGRIVDTCLHAPDAKPEYIKEAVGLWADEKFWQEDIIRSHLNYTGRIIFPLHHESHAASAFFPSPFPESAILTMDGVGEWMTTTMGVGEGNHVSLLKHIDFPHSLGMLYSAFTYFVGFKVNSGEYKLMGLAPYGEPRYADLIRQELIDVRPDGSFRLNMEYFGYAAGDKMITDKFRQLFDRRERKPDDPVTQQDMDLAKSIQVVLEDIILKLARHMREVTGKRFLCLAGGVALNCVANGLLLRERVFDKLWIQPASGDAGGALGAALYAWYQYLDHPRNADGLSDAQQGSLLGTRYSEKEIERMLLAVGAKFQKLSEQEIVNRMCNLIVGGKVVGHFAGRMEFGPRALGNRSILGDARSPEMQKIMNLKIKYRESFRPFAPAVTEEAASEYFELNESSPYMLLTAPVRESVRVDDAAQAEGKHGMDLLYVPRSKIPAITHVDYSARVQTVSRESNPRFHSVIDAVGKATGIPVIINTSFNVRGEPIVCTPFDAYACFMNTEMDYLVIENYLMVKSEQPAWDPNRQDRNFDMD